MTSRQLSKILCVRFESFFEEPGAYRCAGLRGRHAFGTMTDLGMRVVAAGIDLQVEITSFGGQIFSFDPTRPSPWRPVFRSRLRGRP